MKTVPTEVYGLINLKTLIITNCSIQKTFTMVNMDRLTILKVSNNDLETSSIKDDTVDSLAPLPVSLQQLDISSNHYKELPRSIFVLVNLIELNLNTNRITSLIGIGSLINLIDLFLDDNMISELPEEMSKMTKIKKISLKRNQINRLSVSKSDSQSIPSSLFTSTGILNIDLEGNLLNKSDIMNFEGVDSFLERRKSLKNKALSGGGLNDNSLFGLE